ncbi:hypothetical protein WME73_47865 [Sorangium sp. So ce302]|uniref:hypothetical protein n=1 Tax=Sorangium sp. So ce302 TaxID=3133297 RepID=UPI003F630339
MSRLGGGWGDKLFFASEYFERLHALAVELIERDDFLEDPPKKWFRLAPGQQVRLGYAGFNTCRDEVRDEATGEVVELRCHDRLFAAERPNGVEERKDFL